MKFTKEQIEKMAKEYAEEQNDCYTNDYYGFKAGFEKALSLFAVNERTEQFNCLNENYAKGIKRCSEWCGEDMCQKPKKR